MLPLGKKGIFQLISRESEEREPTWTARGCDGTKNRSYHITNQNTKGLLIWACVATCDTCLSEIHVHVAMWDMLKG